ncbi:MAG: GNAT family N-acetyltransferase [Elusimicrobia bacterium]|nr:GNAT family N-acetyltransferase [Elusimicrobiota bacterium]
MDRGTKIRRAGLKDAEALRRLAAQLGYPDVAAAFRARLRRIIRSPRHAVFVADHEGVPCGWLHVRTQLFLELPEHAEIAGLVVDERCRSGGLGAALERAAQRWAREKRLPALRVRCNVIRKRTHGFYLRRGFELEKTQKVFMRRVPR